MIKFSELLVLLFAAILSVSYVLIMPHYILKNEADDLANLAKSGPMEPHECCCESAAKALAGGSEVREAVGAY